VWPGQTAAVTSTADFVALITPLLDMKNRHCQVDGAGGAVALADQGFGQGGDASSFCSGASTEVWFRWVPVPS
jgi:hypothetical protein